MRHRLGPQIHAWHRLAEELHTNGTWLAFDVPEGWKEADLTDSMTSAAYAIQSLVPLLIRCDRNNFHVVPQVSEKIFERRQELLLMTADHVANL
ncbi:hypothetical protein MKY41_04590 [Sporosarcina sp. FSL W7-1349]|uniref:hypothetical protein n=1 Tax=Sporosarcina sp. FSL W7-1349 TaxID=2921561 RepID=UPI0030F54217